MIYFDDFWKDDLDITFVLNESLFEFGNVRNQKLNIRTHKWLVLLFPVLLQKQWFIDIFVLLASAGLKLKENGKYLQAEIK